MKPRFHFVEDYRALVRDLLARYPRDEAMARAVGGSYDAVGEVEKQMLVAYGLKPSDTIVDIGCGSGRLAKALASYLSTGRYLGTDVVPELLNYAFEVAPEHTGLELVDDISIPFPDACADFACFFSVFTHLLPEECYCYLLEAKRVVKPGGRIVFSFLDYARNWTVFEQVVGVIQAGGQNVHLHTFIGVDAIEAWASHLGLRVLEIRAADERFVRLSRPIVYDSGERAEELAAMGHGICLLERP
jgi:SAM-dependent methyltransferase